jgi:hypothetical protein
MSSPLTSTADRDAIINPLLSKVMGTNLTSQPSPTAVHDELDNLIGRLCPSGCAASRTPTVVKATCAAALGSGTALIQ